MEPDLRIAEINPAIIDTDVIMATIEVFAGDTAVLLEVIDYYIDHTPKEIEKIHTAIQESNSDAIFHIAHTLKSSSALLGANRFAELCNIFESYGKNKLLIEAGNDFADIKTELETMLPELVKLRQGLIQHG